MKKVIIIGCLITSGIFLYLSFSNFQTNPSKKNIYEQNTYDRLKRDSTKIRLSFFNEKYDKSKITAIGVIAKNTCAGCINEFMEFSKLIKGIDEKFFNNQKIDKIFAVIALDSLGAIRFRKIHTIKQNVFFVAMDTKLAHLLSHWDENKVANQWIFVDNSSSTICNRILVLSSITPLNFKRDILNRAIFTKGLNI